MDGGGGEIFGKVMVEVQAMVTGHSFVGSF